MFQPETFEIARAHRFAAAAHGGSDQRRKYTGEPYIVHPEAVADIVRTVPHTDAMICAALLHDVVEDTSVVDEMVFLIFGRHIADLVFWLTDISKPEHGNREMRKLLDRTHSAAAPAEAQTIKVADLIDNTRSIVAHDPDFAVVYMREKRLLLDALTKADSALREIAEGQLRAYEAARRAFPRPGQDDTPAINEAIRIAQEHGVR